LKQVIRAYCDHINVPVYLDLPGEAGQQGISPVDAPASEMPSNTAIFNYLGWILMNRWSHRTGALGKIEYSACSSSRR
jgi:hypothetical protein